MIDLNAFLTQYTNNKNANETKRHNKAREALTDKRYADTVARQSGLDQDLKDQRTVENKRADDKIDLAAVELQKKERQEKTTNLYKATELAIKNKNTEAIASNLSELNKLGMYNFGFSTEVYKNGFKDILSGNDDTSDAVTSLKAVSRLLANSSDNRSKNLDPNTPARIMPNANGSFSIEMMTLGKDGAKGKYVPLTIGQSSDSNDVISQLDRQQGMQFFGALINTQQGLNDALTNAFQNDPQGYSKLQSILQQQGVSQGVDFDDTKDKKYTTKTIKTDYGTVDVLMQSGKTISRTYYDNEGNEISNQDLPQEAQADQKDYRVTQREMSNLKKSIGKKLTDNGFSKEKSDLVVKEMIKRFGDNYSSDEYNTFTDSIIKAENSKIANAKATKDTKADDTKTGSNTATDSKTASDNANANATFVAEKSDIVNSKDTDKPSKYLTIKNIKKRYSFKDYVKTMGYSNEMVSAEYKKIDRDYNTEIQKAFNEMMKK